MNFKMSPANCRPFCFGLYALLGKKTYLRTMKQQRANTHYSLTKNVIGVLISPILTKCVHTELRVAVDQNGAGKMAVSLHTTFSNALTETHEANFDVKLWSNSLTHINVIKGPSY